MFTRRLDNDIVSMTSQKGVFMRFLMIFAALGLFSVLPAQQAPTFAWAPLPVQPATWVAPNKPIWKLADLLAHHKVSRTGVRP